MHSDLALHALSTFLNPVRVKTLWFADEHAEELIKKIVPQALLTIVTNRFDLFVLAKSKSLTVILSDFVEADYSNQYDCIVYRISKEKALVHHILKQSSQFLSSNGKLIISGYKQEGIKTYGTTLNQKYNAHGKIKKEGKIYLGEFTFRDSSNITDQSDYHDIVPISTGKDKPSLFFSKPGVYGWKKMDKGSNLLLKTLNKYLDRQDTQGKTALDLGCGYGWLFLNLEEYAFTKIVATDNNVAAVKCAKRNCEQIKTEVEVVIDDCAHNINTTFDYIFCNPPFHQGFSHKQALTEKFVATLAERLQPEGQAILVVNEFIRLQALTQRYKLYETKLTTENGFSVVKITRK